VGAERDRIASFGKLEDGLRKAGDWYIWGPYLSERQWGTVREDYSESGSAWSYLPHDHARSRAYRWGEDGLAGFSDIEQRLCLALALWNGSDPILKERAFGLTGEEGNHGEDVKEYWWYLDALPSHAWNRWRYHYPQAAFPYADLVETNRRRGKSDPEFELLDTGVFDGDRYWIVEVVYAKASPLDLLMQVRVTNAAPHEAALHVLPTVWFRNTWTWGTGEPKPVLEARSKASLEIVHPFLGELDVTGGPGPDGSAPKVLVCDNETNSKRLFGVGSNTTWPKDGINDHVIHGAATVNPEGRGTKAAFWYQVSVGPRATVELRLRLRPRSVDSAAELGPGFDQVIASRRHEADEFYAEITPDSASAEEAMVMRQAFSGMLWSKQLYAYDVGRWLDGDPTQPPPPERRKAGRNARWRNFDAFDVMSMPDKWEYPWFAAWDLAFHCVTLAHLDPAFAKYQLAVLCREWFQAPNGALPAYEWDFSDVNPPVHAYAALEIFAIDGARDFDFLSRIFDKLLVNFTWWVNREDARGNDLFEGGFLGLDNIGPLDRSHLPVGGILEQSDASGWMAAYAIAMCAIAITLQRSGRRATADLALKFLEHFVAIRGAMDEQGLWDERDGLFYDRLLTTNGTAVPIRARSMVGIIPVLAAAVVDEDLVNQALTLGKQTAWFLQRAGIYDPDALAAQGIYRGEPGHRRLLVGVVGIDRLKRIFARLFDEGEFLSAYGLRSLSAYHREHPYEIEVDGVRARIDYEPAESTTGMFGGNSNWRGPIWFPLNWLVVRSLGRYHQFFGDDFLVEYPTGSGQRLPLDAIARDLGRRLTSIFLTGPDGRRPCFGWVDRLQGDPAWKDNLLFNEYFHADNAAGLGAGHQTGWTGLVADLIRLKPVPSDASDATNRRASAFPT
jgi:hypothetical protein